jgi:ParB-like chromosome segregation protein Spo0J
LLAWQKADLQRIAQDSIDPHQPRRSMSKKKQFALVSSEITLETLQQIEATEERTTNRPSHLKVKNIHVADQVFQPRSMEGNIAESLDHIEELARVLRTQGRPLDPILVTPVGKRFFVVDGHHRLSAYRAEKWSEAIPVEVLDAPFKEARETAIALNIKNKLPMTKNDKYELAWDLVKSGDYSKSKIMEMTTVADGTVANMRRTLRSLEESEAYSENMSWRQARRHQSAADKQDYDEWVDQAAKKLADQIIKNVGVKFVKRPDVLARALETISISLPTALVREWFEVAYALIEEHKEEMAEDGLDI